jgi:hypothetical protein
MALELGSLQKAVDALSRALDTERSFADAAAADNPRTRKELYRIAAREGLVRDPVAWFRFGDARNVTSHIYDEDKALKDAFSASDLPIAIDVVDWHAISPEFRAEIERGYEVLRERG